VELRQKSETLSGVWLALILSFVLERPVSAASISALPPEPKRKADKNMWLPRELRTRCNMRRIYDQSRQYASNYC
jgi:hypothetical protein